MGLLSENNVNRLPKLYGQEGRTDPIVVSKIFNPRNSQVMLIMEGDGKDSVYGYLIGGIGSEFGFFSLSDLKSAGFEEDNGWKPVSFSVAKAQELVLSESEIESASIKHGEEDVGRVWNGYSTRTNLVEGNRVGYQDGEYVFFIPNKIDIYDDRYDCRIGSVVMTESEAKKTLEEAGYIPEEIDDIMWRAEKSQKLRGIALDESVELEIKTYHATNAVTRKKTISMKDFM